MRERLNNISLIRLISCIFIFVFHILLISSALEGKSVFPFYIGVGIFTFLSAFLYSGKKIDNKKEFFAKNRKKILIPVAVFMAIYLIAVIVGYVSIGNFTFKALIDLVSGTTVANQFIIGIMNLWYVPVILLCYLFLPSLYKIFYGKEKVKKFYIYLAVILELVIACFFRNPLTFSLFFLGYIFGYFYKNQTEKYQKNKLTITLCSGLAFFATFAIYFCVYDLCKTSNYFLTFLKNVSCEALVGAMAASLTVFLFQIFLPLNKCKWLSKIFNQTDKITYEFYIVHQSLMVGTMSLLYATKFFALNVFITVCVTLALAILVEVISKLIFNKIDSNRKLKEVSKNIEEQSQTVLN